MTKQELAFNLAERSSLNRSQAVDAIETLMDIMSDTFANGQSIFLRGFGTFKVLQRRPKLARNITLGTAVNVPARKVVKFIPCNELKNRVKA